MVSTSLLTLVLLVADPNESKPDRLPAEPVRGEDVTFDTAPYITPGTWWNLYFTKDDNPLKRTVTIHAVRVVQINPSAPNWIRVAYPRQRSEHTGIISIAAQSIKAKKSPDEMVRALEASVSDWKYEWFNLDYVVRMNSVTEEYGRQLTGGKMDVQINVERIQEVVEEKSDNR